MQKAIPRHQSFDFAERLGGDQFSAELAGDATAMSTASIGAAGSPQDSQTDHPSDSLSTD
jgi:hypothetical protein